MRPAPRFDDVLDRARDRSRLSVRARAARLRSRAWHLGQASLAAGVAWLVATEVFGHTNPFFAPIAAVVSLGTSYGQRLRRVAEVTVGVAVGVFTADVLVRLLGTGWWQVSLVVLLAMTAAMLLDGGPLIVTQAAVQSIVVVSFGLSSDASLLRWTDAVIGGAVALVAASVVPRAPLRRPREQASRVVSKISRLLRAAADAMNDGDPQHALDVLGDARTTDALIRELSDAADEGLSVVASSPFRRRHRTGLQRVAQVVEPLDLALRNTRVLVRRVAVSSYQGRPVPPSYRDLCVTLADATDLLAAELAAERSGEAAKEALLDVGRGTALVERTGDLSSEVVLAQLRSIVVDLLRLTGLGVLEATDALPPPR